jgi:hypothetical protein
MQGKLTVESTRWVIALLLLCACGVGFIVYVALPLPDIKLAGGFLLAIGLLHSLFYKRSGQKYFAQTQSLPPYFARFWASIGERGIQLLFLGFGIILTVAGGILIILGAA